MPNQPKTKARGVRVPDAAPDQRIAWTPEQIQRGLHLAIKEVEELESKLAEAVSRRDALSRTLARRTGSGSPDA